ncbi:MAG: long-chain-fatty-acid--CoA ligase [Alphaproteobacteria bacterium]|nr:long-chain-fatty-acid--CoA ligase [Alphaproteobacteria bacterium]
MRLTHMMLRAARTNRAGSATVAGQRRRNWQEFAARVARLAGGLKRLGIGPGERVAILALNGDRYLEFFFAVPWAGAVFVPINTRLAVPEIAFWLNDSGSQALFIDDAFLPLLPRLKPALATVRHLVYLGDGPAPAGLTHYEALHDGAAAADDAERSGHDPAGIFYTGGTTGQSKGVMLSHANLHANALNAAIGLRFDRHTNWLHAAPMFHLADGTSTFAVTLMGGAHCFIPKFDAGELLAAIERYRASHSCLVPTMINLVVNHPDLPGRDIASFRGVLYGASPMPEALIRKALDVMPRVGFFHGYGQSECSPMLTLMGPEYHVLEGPNAGKLTSCGQPAAGVEVKICDQAGNELPRGQIGEIRARGANVMLGYWNQPELTRRTIVDGWIRTGDGATMDEDGFVYIVDRLKDMIISGGENVYSAEVEDALYRHPAVLECAVIGIPHDKWGEQVHAIVRLRPAATAGAEALIRHCKALIANYKCPRSVAFVEAPLPLSGAGKILKTELRKPYWSGRRKQVN